MLQCNGLNRFVVSLRGDGRYGGGEDGDGCRNRGLFFSHSLPNRTTSGRDVHRLSAVCLTTQVIREVHDSLGFCRVRRVRPRARTEP